MRAAADVADLRRAVPPAEARLTPAVYPALAFLFRTLLRLTPVRAAQAADNIRAASMRRIAALPMAVLPVWRPVDAGRHRPGCCQRAVARAPRYGAKMPTVDAMADPIPAFVRELREHPTAGFVDRLYKDAFKFPG